MCSAEIFPMVKKSYLAARILKMPLSRWRLFRNTLQKHIFLVELGAETRNLNATSKAIIGRGEIRRRYGCPSPAQTDKKNAT